MSVKKFIDGIFVGISEEEAAMIESAKMQYDAQEKRRPLNDMEVLRMIARGLVNVVNIPDQTALRMKSYYPAFEELEGQEVPQGFKLTYKGDLWKVRQLHNVSSIYPPSVDTAALYERIEEEYDGTMFDPIPYSGAMAVEEGKFYTFKGILYECIRTSGVPLYAEPAELLGNYFKVAEGMIL